MNMYLVRPFVLLGLLILLGLAGYGQGDTTDTFCKEISRIVAIINDPKDSIESQRGGYIRTESFNDSSNDEPYWRIYNSKITISGSCETTFATFVRAKGSYIEVDFPVGKSFDDFINEYCKLRELLFNCFPYGIIEDAWSQELCCKQIHYNLDIIIGKAKIEITFSYIKGNLLSIDDEMSITIFGDQ
jgi:hypothetical protein